MRTWALVVGGKGGRRSHAARAVAAALSARGLRVGGFTQRTEEAEGGAKRVDLVRLPGGETAPLARSAVPADAAACSLAFDRGGSEAARRWVEADAAASDVLVVDGLGKLELGGEGNRPALERALASGRPVVLAVRDDQLVYAMEALGLDEPLAAWSDGEGPAALERFAEAVARAARGDGAPAR